MIARRRLLFGLAASAFSAPAIVRVGSLMRINVVAPTASRGPAFGFAQRLYADVNIRRISPLLDAGLSHDEVAARLNVAGFAAINGAAWDAHGVGQVVRLDHAIRLSRPSAQT